MTDTPSRWAGKCRIALVSVFLLIVFICATTPFVVAQIHGIPPSVTSIQNHFPPYLPNVPASVTSLGPHGYVGPPAFPVYPHYPGKYPGFGFGYGYGKGYGYSGYGGIYAVPYYVPFDDASYGGDAGGGPYMSGSPEQTLHIVVDTPPGMHVAGPSDDSEVAASPKSEPPPEREVLPIDQTTLIFRDGHKQQVTNYAVMGHTLYVFDAHKRKIPLQDLDVPATIKANDDRGIEFRLPNPKQS